MAANFDEGARDANQSITDTISYDADHDHVALVNISHNRDLNEPLIDNHVDNHKYQEFESTKKKLYWTIALMSLLLLYCISVSTYCLINLNSNNSNNSSSSASGSSSTSNSYNSSTYVAIGDYKLSARNQSHDGWLLCNGDWLSEQDYSQLYNVIQNQFDTDSIGNYFQLPNVSDSVIGIIGNKYNQISNNLFGSEFIQMNESHLASHSHYIAYNNGLNQACETANGNATTNHKYSEHQNSSICSYGSYNGASQYAFCMNQGGKSANYYKSSSIGDNANINVMQPTKFIANLFIYSGVLT